ncbi:MAG: pyruvate kinase [Candidatus Saccharimonadales bacterium]
MAEVTKIVPLKNYKRTKLIASLGPSTANPEAIKQLIESGANGLRLNFSYGNYQEHAKSIDWIRMASKELHKPVAIIMDLQGPLVRLGNFGGIINVQKGQTLLLGFRSDWQATGVIPTEYDLASVVKRGEQIYLYDGRVQVVVTSIKDGIVCAEAKNKGILIQYKTINLPDTDFAGDIITEKDKRDLAFASENDIDYVAMGFVQTARDIEKMRRLIKNLGLETQIITKIETRAATENIEPIIEVSDAVMVNGDNLVIETSAESVPILQRQIIGLGIKHAKPTIVASQMLANLSELPEPTAAEASDITTAVLVGADSIILGDGTANGQYALEAVRVAKRLVRYAQNHAPVKPLFMDQAYQSRQAAISASIIGLAASVGAKAIVAETKSGATALQIASHRPEVPIIAVTPDARVAQQLAIVYGIKSFVRPASHQAVADITDWLRANKILSKGDIVVSASGQRPGVVGTTDTIKVRQLD